jgi:Excreted virulence factor EspC, type VII ESX diderm
VADEGFAVHPEALRGYAGLLDRNNGYLREMRVYLDGPGSDTRGLMGVMFLFQAMAEELAAWQRGILDQMTQKLADTSNGLRQAADSYATTDTKHATEMDKTTPTAPNRNAGSGRGAR